MLLAALPPRARAAQGRAWAPARLVDDVLHTVGGRQGGILVSTSWRRASRRPCDWATSVVIRAEIPVLRAGCAASHLRQAGRLQRKVAAGLALAAPATMALTSLNRWHGADLFRQHALIYPKVQVDLLLRHDPDENIDLIGHKAHHR